MSDAPVFGTRPPGAGHVRRVMKGQAPMDPADPTDCVGSRIIDPRTDEQAYVVYHIDELYCISERQATTLQGVIESAVRNWFDPAKPNDKKDLTVWRGGRIQAVIRMGQDGRPQVTTFAGAPE